MLYKVAQGLVLSMSEAFKDGFQNTFGQYVSELNHSSFDIYFKQSTFPLLQLIPFVSHCVGISEKLE